MAAGEITAPSLLARDVHKLCITLSGAHTRTSLLRACSRMAATQAKIGRFKSIKRYRDSLRRDRLFPRF